MATASQIINKARSYIGVKETGQNNVIFNTEFYGHPVEGSNYHWCCVFVWCVFKQCNASDLFYNGQKVASCTAVLDWAISAKLTVNLEDGRYGDVILFDWDNSGDADHIGFIEEKIGPGTYRTIEGNADDQVMECTRTVADIRAIVRIRYSGIGNTSIVTQHTTSALTIDYKKLHPYIITMDHNTSTKLNWKLLKEIGVIGAVVEGGYLFSSLHKKQERFRNPLLRKQIESLDTNKIPYGLYMTCRPKCKLDAQTEMEEFTAVLRAYPPSLGVWLQLGQMTSKRSLNDVILDVYKEQLIRLGFKKKIGLYLSYNQLNFIHWDKHSDDWFLWIVDHIEDEKEIEKLLDPEFFDTEGNYK